MGVERVSRKEEFILYRNGRSTIRLHDISGSSIVKPTRCTISHIYPILEQHSTCFGQSFHPSSGVPSRSR